MSLNKIKALFGLLPYSALFNVLLFQEKSHHFLMQLSIRLIPHREIDPCLLPHREIDPCLLIYNALIM